MRAVLVALALVLAAGPAGAVNPDEMLADPALERRAREISKGLRCVVCQNQSIDDSDAELARDLRVLVRERLVQGDSNQDVIDYVVGSYGDFVLMKPPVKAKTYVLWFGPVLLVGAGALATVVFMRRRARAAAAPAPDAGLSDDERARLAAILGEDEAGERS